VEDKLRILYHHRTLGDGAEGIHIREMVNAFRDLGHDVRVVSLVGDNTRPTVPGARRWSRLAKRIPSSAYELAELAYNVVGRRALAKAVREFEPDAIYDRYNSYSTAAVTVGRRAGLPILLEVNSPVAYERTEYEHLKLKLPRLAKRYERRICTGADHVFAVSTPLRDYLVREYHLPDTHVTVLPNGANPKTFHPNVSSERVRARYGLDGRVVVGFVGILRPWHGVEMLIDAIAALCRQWPDLHLLIVGDGPIQQELEHRAERMQVRDRMTFTGRVAHDEVREHVAAMDVAVSPRATFYASPMKLLEYMALAKPVVAPDLANIRDILEHGVTGLLFEPERVEDLTSQLRRLLQDRDLRHGLGMEARRRIESRFNWRYNAQRVTDSIERLVAEQAVRRPVPA
jgi:glycosyltransferase involved in cell wall biosynthesis